MKNLDFYAGYHLFPTKYYLTFYARPFFEKNNGYLSIGKRAHGTKRLDSFN